VGREGWCLSSSSFEEGSDDLDGSGLDDEMLRAEREPRRVSSSSGEGEITRTDLDIHGEARNQQRNGAEARRRSRRRGLAIRSTPLRSRVKARLDSRRSGDDVRRRSKE